MECGCVAACGTALMRNDLIGATSINRLARFYIDPRDNRTAENFYELIGDDSGVFGCMGLLACEDVCPKKIPLQDQLGIMRCMATLESVRGILPSAIRKSFWDVEKVAVAKIVSAIKPAAMEHWRPRTKLLPVLS